MAKQPDRTAEDDALVPLVDPTPGRVKIELEEPFKDARGTIQSLLELTVRSVGVLTTEPGSLRANHYHKTDWHYCYVVSGRIEYYERPVGSSAPPKRTEIAAGELFFTPAMVEHAMYFPERTVFMTFSRNPRDHETYESDIVRVALLDKPGSSGGHD
jgi:quercetin dioxygenase-like cupin family protein